MQTSTLPPVSCGLIPLVIGVTGHRDLRAEDTPALEARVHQVFDEIRVAHPHTPLTVLSALAEGADRLAARVALEAGCELRVALPMPRDMYAVDFAQPNSLKDFDELAARGSFFELPADEADDRDERYRRLGAYLAQHSQILIALWDGVTAEKPGGTSQVVRIQRYGYVKNSADPPPGTKQYPRGGCVYHIVTPRQENPAPEGERFAVRLLPPLDEEGDPVSETQFQAVLGGLEQFNCDYEDLRAPLAAGIVSSQKQLTSDDHFARLTAADTRLSEWYAAADQMSLFFAGRVRRARIELFVIAFIAFLLMEIYSHFWSPHHPDSHWLWLLSSVVTIVAWVRYHVIVQRRWETRYLEYRSLAEALRVQFYWNFAGVRGEAAEYYFRKEAYEFDWIRGVLRVLSVVSDPFPERRRASTEQLQSIRARWVDNQSTFYKNRSEANKQKVQKMARYFHPVVRGLAVTNLLLALGCVLLAAYSVREVMVGGAKLPIEEARHIILSMVALFSAGWILRRGYIEQMGYASLAREYERMHWLFRTCSRALTGQIAAGRLDEARSTLHELGREALFENGDWLMFRRERPLKVVGSD
jgi:hypothetical protein